jgi:hypothetical protein
VLFVYLLKANQIQHITEYFKILVRQQRKLKKKIRYLL